MNDERRQFGILAPSVGAGDYPIREENRRVGDRGPEASSMFLSDLDQQQRDSILATIPGGISNLQYLYPLSPLQEGMLFHHLLSEGGDTYVLSTIFELQSQAQVEVLACAIQKVIDRHEALRTAVLWEGLPRALQVVYRQATLSVNEITLNLDGDVLEQMEERRSPRHQKLQLQRAPLVRFEFAQDRERRLWYAVLYVHHIVCDHASLRLAVTEIMTFLQGRGSELATATPFHSYVMEALSSVQLNGEEEFFRCKLADVTEPTAPFGLLNVHSFGEQLEEARQGLDLALAREVRLQAQRAGVSVARLFHLAWGLVIARTSGRNDVVFGTVLQTRRQRGAHAACTLGMSVNTLPLRLSLGNATTIELLERTHRELSELRKYEQIPLTRAQGYSGVAPGSPLFTTVLNYRRSPPESEFEGVSAAGIRLVTRGEAWTNYPFTMTVDDLGEGFALTAQTDLLKTLHGHAT